jgi:hypothetical protein
MAVIRPAHDVVLVGGSIFVHAHVPIDVHAPIDVGVTSSVMASTVMASTVMASTVMSAAVVTSCMTTTVVTSSVASSMAFRICRRHHAKTERCGDRKNERKLLQHFCFPPKASHRTVTISS